MHKILLTGITGFLGSHIAESLLDNDEVELVGLRRFESDTWRCESFVNKIEWITIDQEGTWVDELVRFSPDIVIHCAWHGVNSIERNNWEIQSKNIEFLTNLLIYCREAKVRKFVFLGSQAEYGNFSGKVKESINVNPTNSYAFAKLSCLGILKTFAQQSSIDWLWLRVFSIFGERESSSWLIPSLIHNMKVNSEMDLTKGEQKYAYMYVKDFSNIVKRVVLNNVSSGIYNISSNHTVSIRELVLKIRDQINPNFKLNFGKVPYRIDQSMHMEGDIDKLEKEIGKINFTDFESALNFTVSKYK